MTDIAGAVRAGTGQIIGAASDAARLRMANTARIESSRGSMTELGRTIGEGLKEYRSMQEARKAEDELLEIEKADTLGRSTGDPTKRIATLNAIQPRSLKGATMRAQLLREAQKDSAAENERKLEGAKAFLDWQQRQRVQMEVERHNRETEAINRAENERLGRPKAPEPTDPNDVPLPPEMVQSVFSRYGINASPVGWSANTLAKIGVKFEAPETAETKAPTGPDQPLPESVRSALEQRAKLPPGSLSGLSYRAWDAIRQNPDEEILRQLQVISRQRDVQDYEPPKVKQARMALEDAEKSLSRFRDAAARADAMVNRVAMKARDDELSAEVATKRAEYERASAAGGASSAPATTPAAGPKPPSEMTEEEIIRELMGTGK